jgi:hypothetical protein
LDQKKRDTAVPRILVSGHDVADNTGQLHGNSVFSFQFSRLIRSTR